MQQAVEIGFLSRVMCKVLIFGSYCSHHTRREKSNFLPLVYNTLLCFFFFFGICDIKLHYTNVFSMASNYKMYSILTRSTNTSIFLCRLF